MDNNKNKLSSLLEEGKNYSSEELPKSSLGYLEEYPLEFDAWVQRVKTIISRSFSTDSAQFIILQDGLQLYGKLRYYMNPSTYDKTKIKLIKALELSISAIDTDKYDEIVFIQKKQNNLKVLKKSNKVFLVHGLDEKIKVEIARFLEKMGLQVTILHEQPNKGKTIIEKFEDYSDVSFAIVLLTPDDVGGEKSKIDDLKSRARQNVIFELGFFIGKLRRQNVCAVYKEGVELPSDYAGVIYIPLDDSGGWKLQIARELKASGIKINLEQII